MLSGYSLVPTLTVKSHGGLLYVKYNAKCFTYINSTLPPVNLRKVNVSSKVVQRGKGKVATRLPSVGSGFDEDDLWASWQNRIVIPESFSWGTSRPW